MEELLASCRLCETAAQVCFWLKWWSQREQVGRLYLLITQATVWFMSTQRVRITSKPQWLSLIGCNFHRTCPFRCSWTLCNEHFFKVSLYLHLVIWCFWCQACQEPFPKVQQKQSELLPRTSCSLRSQSPTTLALNVNEMPSYLYFSFYGVPQRSIVGPLLFAKTIYCFFVGNWLHIIYYG